VYVRSGHDTEIRLTLEAAVDLLNALADADTADGIPADVRTLLDEHQFTRAAGASAAAITRVETRIRAMAPALRELAEGDAEAIIDWVNHELATIPITPSLTEHDGADLHIHWTPSTATFDDQVVADVLMALAQEVCDHGTERFGRCAANDCDHLFFDATRNRSRRFCADPRCASRTHTADHRARRRSS
jgi:predicted RNA-binding Zn ribbon-like protein